MPKYIRNTTTVEAWRFEGQVDGVPGMSAVDAPDASGKLFFCQTLRGLTDVKIGDYLVQAPGMNRLEVYSSSLFESLFTPWAAFQDAIVGTDVAIRNDRPTAVVPEEGEVAEDPANTTDVLLGIDEDGPLGLLRIDWALLRSQKAWLAKVSASGPAQDPVEGLLNFLDGFMDVAVEAGVAHELVFGKRHEFEDEKGEAG